MSLRTGQDEVEEELSSWTARSRLPAGCNATHLDEILAFWLRHEWLELWGGEGVDESGFGHDKKEDLGAGQDGEFVGLEQCDALAWTPQ